MGKEFDFESFKAEALKQIYAGKPFTGKDGVLAPLLENLLNAALEGEMDAHLSAEERELGNRRNGVNTKFIFLKFEQCRIPTLPHNSNNSH